MHTVLNYCVVRISNTYLNTVLFVCRESLDSQDFGESQCRTAVLHCCKGDAASQWEMAILGVSELRNH